MAEIAYDISTTANGDLLLTWANVTESDTFQQYRLADGRAEVTEEQETGEYDEQGNPITETVVVQSAIDPLPAQIEQPTYDPETGEQTGTEMVPNPAIVQDDAERAAAQAVVDGADPDVAGFDGA